jgi:hypothetical protein
LAAGVGTGSYGAEDVFLGEEDGVLIVVEMIEADIRRRATCPDHDAHRERLIGDALLRQREGRLSRASSRFSKAASAGR